MINNSETSYLTRIILKVINEKKPQSIRKLAKMLKENIDISEEDIIKIVLNLQAEGIIKFENQAQKPFSLATFLKTDEAFWYWMTIVAGIFTAFLVFAISENAYPWIYARNFLGVIFVIFLPGYAFTKAFFQSNRSQKSSRDSNLIAIERVALSIGMSIAIVSIVGLVLYYSPLGLDLPAIVFSLLGFTLVFATTAVIRAYQKKKTVYNNMARDVKKGM